MGKEVNGDYSDRLFQFDSAKYDRCCMSAFGNKGQYFGDRDPKAIQQFLSLYHERPQLRLEYVIEGCNPSSGYPYWVFGWSDQGEKK